MSASRVFSAAAMVRLASGPRSDGVSPATTGELALEWVIDENSSGVIKTFVPVLDCLRALRRPANPRYKAIGELAVTVMHSRQLNFGVVQQYTAMIIRDTIRFLSKQDGL